MKQSINLSIDADLKEFITRYTTVQKTSASAIVEAVFRKIRDSEASAGESSRIQQFISDLPEVSVPEDTSDDSRLTYLKEKYLD